MDYDELNLKEKRIFDKGGLSSLRMLQEAIQTVSENNPDCTSIKVKDLYTVIKLIKEKL